MINEILYYFLGDFSTHDDDNRIEIKSKNESDN